MHSSPELERSLPHVGHQGNSPEAVPHWKDEALQTIRLANEVASLFLGAPATSTWSDIVVPNGRGKFFPLSQFIESGGGVQGLLDELRSTIETAADSSMVEFDLVILGVLAQSLRQHAVSHGAVHD